MLSRLYKYILLLSLLTSCATSTYHIEIAPRYDDLGEKFFNEASFNFNDYNVSNSGVSGFGGQISLVETTKYTYARIGYFRTQVSSNEYTYSSFFTPTTTESVKLEGEGIEFAVGLKLWYLRPFITSTFGGYNFVDRPTESVTLPSSMGLGFGLALDIPISDSIHLLVNNQNIQGVVSHSIGLMFGGWTIQGTDSEK